MKIKLLTPEAKLPTYAHKGDAGMDVYSAESFVLHPGEQRNVKLGFAAEIPEGMVALVWAKSGLASAGVIVLGGVIDASYRGEWHVQLMNHGRKIWHVAAGNKIAQVLIQPVNSMEILQVEELTETTRGNGGFGSTGK